MTEWMSTYAARGDVGRQMMWGDPDRLRSTCREWAAANPPAGAVADADVHDWCDSMVGWMVDHMGSWSGRGDWDDWMMRGPMGR